MIALVYLEKKEITEPLVCQEMDVSNSTGVTDLGIRALCYPHLATDSWNNRASGRTAAVDRVQSAKRTRKISAAAVDKIAASGCMLWLPRLALAALRRRPLVEKQSGAVWLPLEHSVDALDWPEDELHSSAGGLDSSCARSLLKLDVRGTGVTASGLQMISTTNPFITLYSTH